MGLNRREHRMCHEPIARPPLPPISGGAGVVGEEDLILHAPDGNRLLSFSARTDGPVAPGILILPDVRGLHPFYKDLAVKFAEVGVHATTLDYFGRTAGIDKRGDDFDFMSHWQQITPEGLRADVEAGLAHLRSEAGGAARRLFTVGFCFGGRLSFNQAAERDLAGVIGFYGRPQGYGSDDADAPVRRAPLYRCQVLGLFGDADELIPVGEVDRFRRTLDEARVQNQIVVYEGAPHSFFDRAFAAHQEACADAWRRMLTFVGA
jgi:carboxymethylenebutenolidase